MKQRISIRIEDYSDGEYQLPIAVKCKHSMSNLDETSNQNFKGLLDAVEFGLDWLNKKRTEMKVV